jgi:hypothetical protein
MIDTIAGLNAYDIDAIRKSTGYLVVFPGGSMIQVTPPQLIKLYNDLRRAVKWDKMTVQQFTAEVMSRSKDLMFSTIY